MRETHIACGQKMSNSTGSFQSTQEEIIEHFVNHSFGTAFLFRPINYKYTENGKRKDGEPCDLFWACDGIVVLFCMIKSKKLSLGKQTKHNVDQLKEFLFRWKSGGDEFLLQGENRFGKRCAIRYCEIDNIVLVSLVGKKCGITCLEADKKSKEIWINAPDSLLTHLAHIKGSLVDFLMISLETALKQPGNTIQTLEQNIEFYKDDAVRLGAPTELCKLDSYEDDILAITLGLEAHKHAQDYENLKFIFDLSLLERTTLAHAALQAIHNANPPYFNNTTIIKSQTYYPFFILAINICTSNLKELIDKSRAHFDTDSEGNITSIVILYSCKPDGLDYRTPAMFTLPPSRQILQAKRIFQLYLEEFSTLKADSCTPVSKAPPPAK